MKRHFDSVSIPLLTTVALYTLITGILATEYIRILPNIGIGILFICAVIYLVKNKISIKVLWNEKKFLSLIIFYIFLLLNLILLTKNENLNYAVQVGSLKIQYLLLPFAFAALPALKKETLNNLFFYFFIIVVLTALWCTGVYFYHHERFLNEYSKAGVMFTPVHHIRYSLMVCYAVVIGLWLLTEKFARQKSIKFYLIAISILFLIYFLHLLAVRTGIVVFYTLILGFAFYLSIKRMFFPLLILLITALTVLFAFTNLIDSLRNKIGYTFYDYKGLEIKENANDYSLARRTLANKVSYKIFTQHPIFGTGEGNLKSEIHKAYKQEHPYVEEKNILLTHNQFLRVLTGCGIIGFFLFVSCFYYPLFTDRSARFIPLLAFYLIITLSFLVEDTLDTQVGLTFSLFFLLFNLYYLKQPLLNTQFESE